MGRIESRDQAPAKRTRIAQLVKYAWAGIRQSKRQPTDGSQCLAERGHRTVTARPESRAECVGAGDAALNRRQNPWTPWLPDKTLTHTRCPCHIINQSRAMQTLTLDEFLLRPWSGIKNSMAVPMRLFFRCARCYGAHAPSRAALCAPAKGLTQPQEPASSGDFRRKSAKAQTPARARRFLPRCLLKLVSWFSLPTGNFNALRSQFGNKSPMSMMPPTRIAVPS